MAARCADCQQPITDKFPGREWGGPRWSHDNAAVCIRALGEAVRSAEHEAEQGPGTVE